MHNRIREHVSYVSYVIQLKNAKKVCQQMTSNQRSRVLPPTDGGSRLMVQVRHILRGSIMH